MAKPVLIDCHCCRGSGKRELTGIYLETLIALRAEKEEINAAELGRKLGVSNEAMANRLVWMEEHGLATRRWNGRECLWSC